MFSLFSLRFYIQKCVIFTFYNLIRASREFEGKVFQKYMSLDALPSVLSFSSPAVFTATLYFFFFFFPLSSTSITWTELRATSR